MIDQVSRVNIARHGYPSVCYGNEGLGLLRFLFLVFFLFSGPVLLPCFCAAVDGPVQIGPWHGITVCR